MHISSTVLIVGDEKNLADLFDIWLQGEVEVHVAYSGEDAIEVFAEEAIDIVILDRRMRGVSDQELLESIREREDSQQIIMITAVQPTEELAPINVEDYLIEPINGAKFLRAVKSAELVLTYEDLIAELLSLAEKKAMLEVNLDTKELEVVDRYGELLEQISELEQQADETLQRLESNYQIDMLVREQRIGTQSVEKF
jgi:response regulator RpfG family c-di-GMP phosphodiesterase